MWVLFNLHMDIDRFMYLTRATKCIVLKAEICPALGPAQYIINNLTQKKTELKY